MLNVFLKILKLFKYTRPMNNEGGFELLEDKYEIDRTEKVDSSEYEKDQKQNEQKDRNQNKVSQIIKPIKVEQWKRERNSRPDEYSHSKNMPSATVFKNIASNKKYIEEIFSMPRNQDLIIREFKMARKTKAFLVFVDGMVDKTSINQFILPQLMRPENFNDFSGTCPIDYIKDSVLSISEITKATNFNEIKPQILNGLSVLFIDDCSEALMMETRGFEKRNIDRPITEQVVKGSQEGFTENLRTNITLLRRIIKNEKLITEIIPTGKLNKVNSAIIYIEGITNPKIVEEVRRRITEIDTDFIAGNGMLEQLIEDNYLMPFPQVVSTERPDRAASFLVEGQVVIITEGDPFALAAPVTFYRLFHSSEDSMLRWQYGTFLRIIRFIGVMSALLIPGLYIALVLYHHQMIPTPFLESIVKSREAVPFPTIVELLLMEIAFELVREGGVRIPGVIGQTLGIVGALILGQVAVQAGLVSPILIVIIALTGLGSFTMPNYSMALAVRIIRFIFVFGGAIAGFYGISLAFILIASMACYMKSFGVPFLAPVAPSAKINPDSIIRQPLFNQSMRSDPFNTPNRKRNGKKQRGDDE
jgi:spore germination protein KA